MAAVSAMPEEPLQYAEIIRTICSDPIFIARIYYLIAFSGHLSELPDHMTTVIGGAAFIMHAYMLNANNIERMRRSIRTVPQTSDIDIVIWHKNKIKEKEDFLSKNAMMVPNIELMLDPSGKNYTEELLTRIKQLLPNIEPSIIDKIKFNVIEKVVGEKYKHMTTNININLTIEGTNESYKVVDVAIKNAIFSQYTEKNRNSVDVTENTTHTDEQNTFPMFVNDVSSNVEKIKFVRIPTLERLIQQQQFGIKEMSWRANTSKHRARIDYLMRHSSHSPLAAPPVAPPVAPPAAHHAPLHPGRSIHSLSKKGGKRRTHRKNKHHKKRHTKRR
jgi:hypothetical protein